MTYTDYVTTQSTLMYSYTPYCEATRRVPAYWTHPHRLSCLRARNTALMLLSPCHPRPLPATDTHYYQPMFTLVGGGFRTLEDTSRPQANVLPKDVDWLRTSATEINPEASTVLTEAGHKLHYEYLVMATGR